MSSTHRSRAAWALLLAAFAIGGVTAASAASLGGVTTAALTATTMTATSVAPTVVAWENFNSTTGTNINGTTTDGGSKTWTAIKGTWKIAGNRAQATTTTDALLAVNLGLANGAIEATVYHGSATSWDAGFAVNANATGTQFLTTEWTSNGSGSLELWSFNAGTWTQLAQATNLYPGGLATAPASIVLRLSAVGANLTASINGVPTVSATLSAANQTIYKNATHTYFGLYVYFDQLSTFDDAHVDT